MAEIVFGFGTSHGPLLATPPEQWDLRANVDRKNKELAFREGTYDFEKLYELRKGEHFEKQNENAVRAERDARCQKQLDVIGEKVKQVNPDAILIVGDDHHEWFLNDIQPTFSIFHGKEVFNRALTKAEEEDKISKGGGYAMKIYYPQKDETYPCPSGLAAHIVKSAVSYKGAERIAVAASGGVSHFVVDEDMDRRLLDAMLKKDYATLMSEPDIYFRSGTSETKNWIVTAGILAETNLKMDLLDYVPCYRSEAGTGSGMAFATWQ